MAAYKKSELKEFDRLTEMASSRVQVARINGRLRLRAFVEKHGQEKCDAMFAALEPSTPQTKGEREP